MDKLFDNIPIDFDCPNCGESLSVTSNQIGETVTCTNCSQPIALEDNGLTDGMDECNKQIDDLFKDFR